MVLIVYARAVVLWLILELVIGKAGLLTNLHSRSSNQLTSLLLDEVHHKFIAKTLGA